MAVARALLSLRERGYDGGVMERLIEHVSRHNAVRGFCCGRVMADDRPGSARSCREMHSLARLAWHALRAAVAREL